MKAFLRRLRGVVKTGLMWAVGSVAFFSGFLALVGRSDGILISIPYFASFGFIVGGVFAGILSMTERHRRLEDLSLRRVALWGAIGGLLVTVAFNLVNAGTVYWQALLTISLLSAGLSSGTVALAKRADRKLIEGDDEPLPALEGE
jgi:peptidoglycan/LPS O-acetylase OafA/YrhL